LNNADTKTNTAKTIIDNVLSKMDSEINPSYNTIKELIDLLLEESVINKVIFEIQDSHVTCTVSCNPAKLELRKYFDQDDIYQQTVAGGRTEQEAFHKALSKMAILTKLS
jgi:hypothetical protein